VLLVEAEYVLGVTAFWLGDPVAATRHLLTALRTYRPEHGPEHVNTYGQDAGAVCAVRLAQTLWTIGRPAFAARALRQAVAHAESVAHPHTLAYVRQFAAWTYIDLGDAAAARREADGALALAEAHGLSGWALRNEALHGYLLAREGHVDRGIGTMQKAARECARWSWRLAVPYDRALLAEVCLAAGRLEEGLQAIEEGSADARETGQSFWDAELLRLRAELLAAAGAPAAGVERLLREAREVAARQRAAALVLRAEHSLRRFAGASR
jgi:predicted ATPase